MRDFRQNHARHHDNHADVQMIRGALRVVILCCAATGRGTGRRCDNGGGMSSRTNGRNGAGAARCGEGEAGNARWQAARCRVARCEVTRHNRPGACAVVDAHSSDRSTHRAMSSEFLTLARRVPRGATRRQHVCRYVDSIRNAIRKERVMPLRAKPDFARCPQTRTD